MGELDTVQCEVCNEAHAVGECLIKQPVILDINDIVCEQGEIEQGDDLREAGK